MNKHNYQTNINNKEYMDPGYQEYLKKKNINNSPPKVKKEKPKKEKGRISNIFLIITNIITFLLLLIVGGALFLYEGTFAWIGSTFAMLILSMILLFVIIFLGKKTHAIMELNALLTGKPISLFFTDHKKMEWKVVEPEGNILTDKKYGSFLINEKGAYVDSKTKNIFLAFNPAVATNAAVECYKVTDSLNKVLNDEKQLSYLRYALSSGSVKDNTIVYKNPQTQEEEVLNEFEIIRENVNFSHLKSLLVTLIPHSITSKIEMTVQQRMSGFGKVNILQIVLIIVGIVGAITLAILLLNIYGGGGETIVREVSTKAAETASETLKG